MSGILAASTNVNLTQAKENVGDKVFLKFGKCHNVYNGKVMDDCQIDQLGMVESFIKMTYASISL